MSETLTVKRGQSPLLVSIPHSGESLGPFGGQMTPAAVLKADTDWHLPLLYGFLGELDATVLVAKHSRYVVDLNRDPEGRSLYPGQNVTELCPTTTFANEQIYQPGKAPSADQVLNRVEQYWKPYHAQITTEIERLKRLHGYALLWDAHSIASRVPRFFEGELPDFNLGTNDGYSGGAGLGEALFAEMRNHKTYSAVLNGRFKGGYITRRYGRPEKHVHAVQLELSQATYMAEDYPFSYNPQRAETVAKPIYALMQTMLKWGQGL